MSDVTEIGEALQWTTGITNRIARDQVFMCTLWNHMQESSTYQHLQHVLCFRINFNDVMLKSRHFWNVVIAAFPLLFLQFDGDSTNLTMTQAFHQVSHKSAIIKHEKSFKRSGNQDSAQQKPIFNEFKLKMHL